MRNPAWTQDELILALRLYLTAPSSPPAKDSKEVRELSHLLRQLHVLLGTQAADTLRNENGVYMKMMNFRAIDPDFTSIGRKGMKAGGKLEKIIWEKYASDPNKLNAAAASIVKAVHSAQDIAGDAANDDPDTAAEEGGIVVRLHKRYERNRTLRRKKISAAKAAGNLNCEVCSFDFEKTFGPIGAGFIEVHHLKPVHLMGGAKRTKLSDLALLCSNCHRMAHRKREPLDLTELRAARGL